MTNLALLIAWLDLPTLSATPFLAEGAGVLVLLAASILVFRTFRERYLLIWIVGWILYFCYREALLVAGSSPTHHRFVLAFAHACFMLAVANFVISVLVYTNSRRFMLPIGILCAIALDAAVVRALWYPDSLGFLITLHILYRTMSVVGAVRVALFARGRKSLGLWLLTAMLLLLHFDASITSRHSLSLGGFDTIIEVLLGLSMIVVALDDSQSRSRRLGVLTAITTAIAEARDYSPMMAAALAQLRGLMNAQAAWFRLLEGDYMVIRQQIGVPKEYLEHRRELRVTESYSARLLNERAAARLRVSALSGESRTYLENAGFDHLLIVPVIGKSSVIGVLTLGMTHSRSYTPEEMRFLTTTSNGLGIAVENLRMLEQIVRSQRQWVSTFDSIEDSVFVHDSDGRILRVNRAFSKRVGYGTPGIIGKLCKDILPNSDHGCAYCTRRMLSGVEGPDPCFGGYTMVSTSSYSEEGATVGTVHIITDTTDRRAAEERYRLLFEEVQEGVFVSTPEGRFLDCNQAFVKLLGYETRAEVLALDITTELYRNPEHRQRFLDEMESRGFVRNHEVIVRRKDGTSVTLLENSFATRDADGSIERLQGFLVDITEKKRAEEEIRRRNRELHALNAIAVVATQSFDLDEILNVTLRQTVELFSAETGAILIFEPNSRVLRRRAAWGHRSEAGAGALTAELPEDFWQKILETRMEILTNKNLESLPENVREFVESEGIRSWVWVIMWSHEKPLGVFGISSRVGREFTFTDENLLAALARQLATTVEKVRLYEETTRAYEDLRKAQEQLLQSEKMSAVGQLISGVAHELNNPLTAILGYAQLLETEPLDDRSRDFVAKLYRQAQRTQRVVQNLLSFARQRKPVKQYVDLRKVVDDTLALRDYDLKLNNIVVERDFATIPNVYADAHQLEQVFLNIVNNAVDAMLETAKNGKLTVRVYREQQWCCVELKDTGPGIKEISRVFDPFYTTKKVGKGTGLGLSICYGIVKEHGGDILALSPPEGGAAFKVKLPVAHESLPSVSSSNQSGASAPVLSGRILLVEDEESVVEFEKEVLTGAGAEVVWVTSGERAIATLGSESFEAVVIDGKMPGQVQAPELYLWIVEHRPEQAVKVLFTLSHGDDPELRRFVEAHQVHTLPKPFQVADLLSAIRRVSSKSRATSA